MTPEELEQYEALHQRKKRFVDGKLARVRGAAHADGRITPAELAEIHRLQARSEAEGKLIERREQQLAKALVPRGTRFLASAQKVPGENAGPFVAGAGAKIVWHTTEGRSTEAAVHEFRTKRSWPHFTLNPQTGRLLQHVAMDVAARALKHPAGVVETNKAHAIQVELVGLASETPHWTAEDYARIAHLARQIEAATGVSRTALATFRPLTVAHLSPAAWLGGSGHCGHQHVPGNDHHDPGALRIDLIV
jgi:hypothetical protein